MDRGHVRAGGSEQRGDLHERPAILLFRRRVHGHEAGPVGERHPEVAPEARVGGSRRERAGLRGKLRAEPALELDESEIHCDLHGIMTLFTLKKRRANPLNPPVQQIASARFPAFLILLLGASLACAQQRAKPASKPAAPSTIEAEHIEGVAELEVTARGKVEGQKEDLTIYSEYLRYNQEFGRVEAEGGVRLQRGVDRFFGPRLRYNTRDDTGTFEQSNFILNGEVSTMRGKGERLDFL